MFVRAEKSKTIRTNDTTRRDKSEGSSRRREESKAHGKSSYGRD